MTPRASVRNGSKAATTVMFAMGGKLPLKCTGELRFAEFAAYVWMGTINDLHGARAGGV